MTEARLIIDPPQDGVLNMAIDQALLENANGGGVPTLRLYRWSKPTLSLGYFQKIADRQLHPASQHCQLVRRKTGGGAILHHHDLTYSLTMPHKNRWSEANEQLYDLVHSALIEQWADLGVATDLFRNVSQEASATKIDPRAFLCFQRRSSGDIVCNGWKVTGSAQRRAKNALLQHGSILIRKSEYAPELAGIQDQAEQSIDWEAFWGNLIKRLETRLQLRFFDSKLSGDEEQAVGRWRRQFAASDWLESR